MTIINFSQPTRPYLGVVMQINSLWLQIQTLRFFILLMHDGVNSQERGLRREAGLMEGGGRGRGKVAFESGQYTSSHQEMKESVLIGEGFQIHKNKPVLSLYVRYESILVGTS